MNTLLKVHITRTTKAFFVPPKESGGSPLCTGDLKSSLSKGAFYLKDRRQVEDEV